jgi:hypothetical protein
MIKTTLRPVGLPKLKKQLSQAEKDFIKDLRAKSKAEMGPIVAKVRSQIPVVAPIKGMLHQGRSKWAVPKVSTYANPRARAKKGRGTVPIVGFRAASPKNAVGFEYGELAGIRRKPPRPVSKGWNSTTVGGFHSYRVNGQGEAMIERLERIRVKPGRFFYRHIAKYLPEIRTKMRGIVDNSVKELNRKLKD